jgi:glucokinase
LAELVSAEFDVQCVIDDAVSAAAVAENALGAGGNASSLLMVTLGRELDVGLLVGGNPVRAADGSHPQAGHLPVPGISAPCYCGLASCWTQVASHPALDQLTSDRTNEFAARALDDDLVAQTVFDLYGRRVAAGLSILLPLVRPARLLLGGTAARYLPFFAAALNAGLQRAEGYAHVVDPAPAVLGDISSAIGVALVARHVNQPRMNDVSEARV